MDTSQYLPMFLAECREHLQELNLAVVRIEEQPDDRATVDEIFRIAHSLKGMSATMGFEGMAALTHQMEDVFELLRQRSAAWRARRSTSCSSASTRSRAAIDAIEADGAERLEPAPLVERLQGLVRDRTPDQRVARHGGAAASSLPAPWSPRWRGPGDAARARHARRGDADAGGARLHGHRRRRRSRHRRRLRARGGATSRPSTAAAWTCGSRPRSRLPR